MTCGSAWVEPLTGDPYERFGRGVPGSNPWSYSTEGCGIGCPVAGPRRRRVPRVPSDGTPETEPLPCCFFVLVIDGR